MDTSLAEPICKACHEYCPICSEGDNLHCSVCAGEENGIRQSGSTCTCMIGEGFFEQISISTSWATPPADPNAHCIGNRVLI